MGFYGNIFNKLQNTFNKIIVGSQAIEATTPEDSIVLTDETDTIQIEVQENQIVANVKSASITSDHLKEGAVSGHIEYIEDSKTLKFK